MTGDGLAEALADHRADEMDRDCLAGLGWVYARRCECGWHGPSNMHDEHLADVVRAHLAERLGSAEAREAVAVAVFRVTYDPGQQQTEARADAALASVRALLGISGPAGVAVAPESAGDALGPQMADSATEGGL